MTFSANVDPVFSHGVGWVVVLIVLLRVLIGFAVLMGAVTIMIWFERKAISDMQSRIGPQRWGPFGLLQTLADGIKLFFKEDLIPAEADRFVFKLAPYLVAGARAHHLRDRSGRGDPAHRGSHGAAPDRQPARWASS